MRTSPGKTCIPLISSRLSKKLADERGYSRKRSLPASAERACGAAALAVGCGFAPIDAGYRDGDLALDQLMAFAITDDQARQEGVYERLSYDRDASTIRRLLTETHVAATDRRARFVGIEAYAEAGGTILRASSPRIAAAIWKTWRGSICWWPRGGRVARGRAMEVDGGASRLPACPRHAPRLPVSD
jgi:hypothetical protein